MSACSLVITWRRAMSMAPMAMPFQHADTNNKNLGDPTSLRDAIPSPLNVKLGVKSALQLHHARVHETINSFTKQSIHFCPCTFLRMLRSAKNSRYPAFSMVPFHSHSYYCSFKLFTRKGKKEKLWNVNFVSRLYYFEELIAVIQLVFISLWCRLFTYRYF